VTQTKRVKKNISPPGFSFFTNFGNRCRQCPASTTEKSVIPWDHSIKNYDFDRMKFDTFGKLTRDQLRSV